MLAPRMRRLAIVSILIGIVAGGIVAIFAAPPIALAVGVVIGVPTAASALLSTRRRIWLEGTTLHSSNGLRRRRVEVAQAATVEFVVRSARISQVAIRVGDTRATQTVPLALYATGGGRELDVLGLRKLADALSASELAPAAAAASVLIEQLRAEARGAGLEERPLYRAVELIRDAGRVPQTTLTDQEVASLSS
ncbi:hypothetical protein EGT67_23450 [Prescottella agglutinans]|uniref:Uncharacterized protein n=1 Tax=Prescottella agglutinans TaxID=1644129 RepID=A0A438B892_9NOCA|nr:hypothetical protein [Prescottella agglutinans]RVW07188.1 hypothetical protein EGT67_23450 [Prescottella agglutinans]